VFKAISATNTPTDPVEKEKQAVAFALAMADGVEAEMLLKQEISGQGTITLPPQFRN
jgi:hypothetical protein